MDFRRPLRVVTPTLDGDVLAVLAAADVELTGRELHRLVRHGSEMGVRKAADRLVEQGIVRRTRVGRAHLYRLNREHIAAPGVEGLATIREQLITQLRGEFGRWRPAPVVAMLFGSVARAEAGLGSDLDVLIVRPATVDPDDAGWRDRVARFEELATRWTGNDTRVLEYDEKELRDATAEPVFRDIVEHGIELRGSVRLLRRLLRSPPK